MTDHNVLKLNTPEHPLQKILREGARKMLSSAIEAEVGAFLKQHGSLKTNEEKLVVVRNIEKSRLTGLSSFT